MHCEFELKFYTQALLLLYIVKMFIIPERIALKMTWLPIHDQAICPRVKVYSSSKVRLVGEGSFRVFWDVALRNILNGCHNLI